MTKACTPGPVKPVTTEERKTIERLQAVLDAPPEDLEEAVENAWKR